MIAWRDHLVRQRTLEAGYLDIVRRARQFPPIFIDQLVQLILRNALDGCEDAFMLRAAELFFRPQKLALQDGSLVAADEETARGLGATPLSPLVSLLGLPAAAGIDVLGEGNAASYWERSDLFDMALDLTAGRRGLAALGDVMTRWVSHLAGDRGRDRADPGAAGRAPDLVCRPGCRGHAHRRCAVERRGARRGGAGARGRPLSAELPRIPAM